MARRIPAFHWVLPKRAVQLARRFLRAGNREERVLRRFSVQPVRGFPSEWGFRQLLPRGRKPEDWSAGARLSAATRAVVVDGVCADHSLL